MQAIKKDIENRVKWIKTVLSQAKTDGVVFGSSGGKDSVLTGVLCKMATDNVSGMIMPCSSMRNYQEDKEHALAIHERFNIKTLEVDLTPVKELFSHKLKGLCQEQNSMAYANMNPRLRMITLYNYAQRKNYLVAGTSNKSERTMGYFTKWGDGVSDFNPIADLTVREIYNILKFLDIPSFITDKAPSAALYEGQTDEKEMGVSYNEIDDYLLLNKATPELRQKIENAYNATRHKREPIKTYKPLD